MAAGRAAGHTQGGGPQKQGEPDTDSLSLVESNEGVCIRTATFRRCRQLRFVEEQEPPPKFLQRDRILPSEESRELDFHLQTSSSEPGALGFTFSPFKSTVSSSFLLPQAISPFLLFWHEFLILVPSFVLVYQFAYSLLMYCVKRNRKISHSAAYWFYYAEIRK